ncbi:MAG: phospholipid carrier-dependent glycosyltransferase [Cellulomonadaceae bacterium]|nr:phospholipid carrier-dependent glycosyltransferase [Cellulomonadaceae bacterium]
MTEFPASATAPPSLHDRPPSLHDRLLLALLGAKTLALGSQRHGRLLAWGGLAVIVVIAAVARLWRLGNPHQLVFDETYYVKDAYTLWNLGFEGRWPSPPDPNTAFEAGQVNGFLDEAAFVVHPQVGKWLIALGIHLGGGAESAFAWRIANAAVGVIAVILVARIARRLFASTLAGLAAGLFMAVDGLAIVHSRIALLDQFLMLFVLVAFGCLLVDRQQFRRRLAARVAAQVDAGAAVSGGTAVAGYAGDWRWPGMPTRWWRLAAGLALGLSIGVKWSGVYFLAVFGLLTVVWDLTARRTVARTIDDGNNPAPRWLARGIFADGLGAFAFMVPTAVVVYVASWWSWFASPGAWGRQWAVENPGQGISWLPAALRSFIHYHQEMWNFHTTLEAAHPYAANAPGWIIQWRPTSFFWERGEGAAGCGRGLNGQDCAQAITSLGNPILWWLAALAIILLIAWGGRLRDWRALAAISGTIAGWLPWFAYLSRTTFTFYAIVFTPWMIFTLVYVAVVAFERVSARRRIALTVTTWTVVALILVVSVLFYPIWSAASVPFPYWQHLMWLPTWV